MARIYKILPRAEWRAAQAAGAFAGSAVDLADGYIHLSTGDQVPGTLARHFAGEPDLHLLAVRTEALDALRWEPSRGGQLFPHLYRELRASDVLWSRTIPLGPQGHDIGDLE